MNDLGLYALYKLHLVDSALVDLKSHVEALDTGKREAEAFAALDLSTKAERDSAKKAVMDVKLLEDQVKLTNEKLAKYDKQLYDGSVTNAREIENLQKEVNSLRKTLADMEASLDIQRDALPSFVEPALAHEAKLKELKATVAQKRAEAQREYNAIQTEFGVKKALRPTAVAEVSPELARRYDAIRQKTGTTAMALVTPQDTCGHCGMHVNEKAKEFVRLGQVTTCEQCGRILFILQPGQ